MGKALISQPALDIFVSDAQIWQQLAQPNNL
jgi:hypothetical protein